MSKVAMITQSTMMPDEQAHMDQVRALAGECVVLLENDGVLPLEGVKKLALYGTGARGTVKGGTGSGDVNSRIVVNIEQGLLDAGIEITSGSWLDRQDARVRKAKEDYGVMIAEKAAETGLSPLVLGFAIPFKTPEPEAVTAEDVQGQETDTAIYVISRNSGEGADRDPVPGDYLLWPEEEASLRLLAENYDKVIVLLNIGGVMDLTGILAIPGISAVVLVSQLGNIGGDIIADVLTGAVNPSGRLTDTWARDYGDYPSSATFSHNNGDTDDDEYSEGIYVGYRWFGADNEQVLYPFGYGLSYTDFDVTPGEVSLERDENGKIAHVLVPVTVQNVGSRAGKETVQIYVAAPTEALDHPDHELKGYGKTPLLAPGESATVTVSIPVMFLSSYSEEKAAWILEQGDHVIRFGFSAMDTHDMAVLRVEATTILQQCTNILPADHAVDTLVPVKNVALALEESDLQVVEIAASDLPQETISYQEEPVELPAHEGAVITLDDVRAGKATVEELVSQLTVRELASYATGRHVRAGEDSVIGNASQGVPGAAGDTSAICAESRGIRPVITADGPAGLRLQPHYKARKDGTILPGGQILGDAEMPFPEYDHPEDVIDGYQYATAIPIGWALAMSWNTELVETLADIVGAEMEKFGVDVWLAPAMNIHRNPMCGRNFEYYSEDPLISGRTAAAITRGVQQHPGKGVCIKHFAANNQEDNRYQTNAAISERALREIYLRGFEVCIRESHPMTIMTSYNLINKVHTANSRDLLQKAARDEWGFDGLIMTDWYSTDGMPDLSQSKTNKYNWGAPAGAVYAGNDLQMPGSERVEDAIVDAVENGTAEDGFTCNKAYLQQCVINVIKLVLRCDV